MAVGADRLDSGPPAGQRQVTAKHQGITVPGAGTHLSYMINIVLAAEFVVEISGARQWSVPRLDQAGEGAGATARTVSWIQSRKATLYFRWCAAPLTYLMSPCLVRPAGSQPRDAVG